MNVTMYVFITALGIPISISIEDMQAASSQDVDLLGLKAYIIRGWPHTKDEVEYSIHKYWPIRHEPAVIDGIAMKGKIIIIPSNLQNQILEQLHSNHMVIEKTRLLQRKSVYQLNMNADI